MPEGNVAAGVTAIRERAGQKAKEGHADDATALFGA
jgi:hypothetical protein